MRFDPIVTNPGRLTILTALLDEGRQDFVTLRKHTQLTDGNLTTHARKLANAGLVSIEKTARAGRPVTYITLTEEGRRAFERHIEQLTTHASRAAAAPAPVVQQAPAQEEAWID